MLYKDNYSLYNFGSEYVATGQVDFCVLKLKA